MSSALRSVTVVLRILLTDPSSRELLILDQRLRHGLYWDWRRVSEFLDLVYIVLRRLEVGLVRLLLGEVGFVWMSSSGETKNVCQVLKSPILSESQ